MRVIVWFVAAWMLAGCNTMDGLSKDLKKGGDQIRKSGEQIGKSLKTE